VSTALGRLRRPPPVWGRRGDPDLALVRSAGRRAAGQAAMLVAASFLLCGGLVLLVVVTAQRHAADSQLRAAVSRAEDVSDPPQGVSLLLAQPDGSIAVTPDARSVLPVRADLTAVLDPHRPSARIRDVHTPAGEFRVRTQRRPTAAGVVVAQAALSLQPEHAERARLLAALASAGGLALLAATALGAVTGRRTVRGLVDTLSRQRRFVADASHELRTPLTVLTTRVQLLNRHVTAARLDPSAREILTADAQRLITDGTRLAEVIDDLLAASEPSPPDAPPTDLPAVAADVVAGMAPVAASQGVTVRLAAADPRLQVKGGSTAVRRSLLALLDNAVRHSPAGATITVSVVGTADAGTVTVTDTGPGIPPDVRSRLFDRFSSGERPGRAAEPPEVSRRYGLGLALVADTVHRVGGEITVDTGPTGTAFTVTLPRRR
jgi:two-component system, OmpR family, sensor kinase